MQLRQKASTAPRRLGRLRSQPEPAITRRASIGSPPRQAAGPEAAHRARPPTLRPDRAEARPGHQLATAPGRSGDAIRHARTEPERPRDLPGAAPRARAP